MNKKNIIPQKTLFVPRDNMIFRGVTPPVPGFRGKSVILNLSHCDSEYISRAIARELHVPIKDNEKIAAANTIVIVFVWCF